MPSESAEASVPDTEASIFDAPRRDLGGRFAGSTIFNLSTQVVRMGAQLISLAVISRMLSPAEFGVMAEATPVLLFLAMLQDLGLTQATVQRQSLTQQQASNMFWTSTLLGVGVGLLLAIASPFIGMFYNDARVGQILLATAPLALITSTGAQHRALLMRQMQFRKLAMRDMAGLITGTIASVFCAMTWHSYWALYAQNACIAVVGAGGAMIATRWIPSRPAPDLELKKMIGFGAGLSGYNLANYFGRYMGNVMIGKVWGGAMLGLYDRGYRILLFPLQQINLPVLQVMNPTLSKLRDEPERYKEVFMRIVRVVMLVTLPGILVLALCADWLIPIVLGPRWQGVIPIFRNLALVGALQTFNGTIGALFITQGRTGQMARWGVVYAVICNISFACGLPWGAQGVALAYGTTELLIRTPIYWWWAGREGPVRTIDLVRLSGPYFAGALLVGGLLAGLRLLWSPHNGILGLIVYAPMCYLLFWAFIATSPTGRRTFKAVFKILEGFRDKLLRAVRPAAPAVMAPAESGEG
jgi:PST family polysaccharide transporter